MARSIEQWHAALLALLPEGDAWPKEPDSELSKLMRGVAETFARIDKRAEDLLNESHPSKTFELFAETEKEFGLPDTCSVDSQSFQQRRARLIQQYQMQGGQSREFFIAVAKALGYDITIIEYRDRLFGDSFGEVYGTPDSNFIWQVNAAEINFSERKHGDSYGEPYRVFGNQQLECVLNSLLHSHRHIIYSYT